MKRAISVLLCLALLLSISPVFGLPVTSAATGTAWDGRTSEDFAGGTGTAEDPYQIANGAQLYQLALIAADSTVANDVYTATANLHYILTANIDMNNKTFPGIAYFSGTLDGAGYRIYNLNIKNTATDYTGLVRQGTKCTLRSLTVEGMISGARYTGAIVGKLSAESTLENCTNYCTVSGTSYVGGICGSTGDNTKDCWNMGSVQGTSYVGGILGNTSGLVISCVNTGCITGSSTNIGGIVGYCNYTGSDYSTLCVNAGDVTGDSQIGGIAGTIKSGYFKNCYNTGKIEVDITTGGFHAGIAAFCDSKGYVSCCYTVGILKGDSTFNEGVSMRGDSYRYYLSGTASSGGVALTATEMTSAGSFVGFDFINVWTWDSSGNYNYPILKGIGLVLPPCSADTHQWNEGVEIAAPTCTDAGELLFTCTKCKETKLQDITALGHNLAEIPGSPATCTENGLTAGSHCTRCDYVLAGSIIPANGHSYRLTTPPTCAGGYPVYTCTVCNHSYTDTSAEPAEHNWDEGMQTVKSTCTKTGTTVYTCLTCGCIREASIPATGHSYNTTITAPTCTEVGYTTYICTDCGHSYIGNYDDATGHDWNAGIVETAPGCETNGKRVYTCRICGETKHEPIPAAGPSYYAKVTPPD
ncbi:MAG: hypothetical protein IKM59_08160, partial [Oscillospiraceae bacterium]|nr:hypothetical protein [Oscillospiraceae bacterium]